jgi:hypothetical protein
LPVEAIHAARADCAAVVPAFLRAFERYLSEGSDKNTEQGLFFAFHLLAEWREKSAYRLLVQFLRSRSCGRVLGDCGSDTEHRVLAAVFDGDPEPLYDLIRDPAADEFTRAAGCEAVAMVTLRGEIAHDETVRFLRACFSELQPQHECFVWFGWQSAIALLGLEELKPLVRQAFARGFVTRSWLEYWDFEQDLRHRIARPDALPRRGHDHNFTLFGDITKEFAEWYSPHPHDAEDADDQQSELSPEELEQEINFWARERLSHIPVTNPLRDVGRNDPCPCGSGKKFKKCCLDAERQRTSRPAA